MRKGDIPCCLAVFFNPQPVDLTLHDYTTLPLLLLASCQRSEAFVFPSLHSDDRPVIPLFLSGKKGRGYSCTFGLENDIPLPAWIPSGLACLCVQTSIPVRISAFSLSPKYRMGVGCRPTLITGSFIIGSGDFCPPARVFLVISLSFGTSLFHYWNCPPSVCVCVFPGSCALSLDSLLLACPYVFSWFLYFIMESPLFACPYVLFWFLYFIMESSLFACPCVFTDFLADYRQRYTSMASLRLPVRFSWFVWVLYFVSCLL